MAMKVKVGISALFLFMIYSGLVSGDTLVKDCANLITKMTNCLPFASGKNDAPTKECCTSVTEVKDSNPTCLCFFIQQIHKGDSNLKDLGIQEPRLLQLPSVCKLANASVTECPKLLNLPANSSDAAIFKNAANASTSTSPSTTSQSETIPTGTAAQLALPVALAIVSIFIFAFSSGIFLLS